MQSDTCSAGRVKTPLSHTLSHSHTLSLTLSHSPPLSLPFIVTLPSHVLSASLTARPMSVPRVCVVPVLVKGKRSVKCAYLTPHPLCSPFPACSLGSLPLPSSQPEDAYHLSLNFSFSSFFLFLLPQRCSSCLRCCASLCFSSWKR